MSDTNFAVGDRVVVTDLRKGKVFKGRITFTDLPDGKVGVQYDDGLRVTVGRGFVRKEV